MHASLNNRCCLSPVYSDFFATVFNSLAKTCVGWVKSFTAPNISMNHQSDNMKPKLRHFEQLESRHLLTVSPEFVADIRPGEVGSKIGSEWIEYKNEIYFTAIDGSSGRELWKTDGTEAGTQLVKDISPGEADSRPSSFVIYKDLLYFRADDGSSGVEVWRSDGTREGTERFLDVNNGFGDSFPGDFSIYQTDLFFSADNGTLGSELYRTDGTVEGTQLVSDIYTGRNGSDPAADSGFIEFDGMLYFSADGEVEGSDIGTELYRTDGTMTELVLDADDGIESSLPTQFTIFKDDLYFISEVPLPPNGIDFVAYLYRVKGTTGEVEQFFAEPVDFREQLTVIGDVMYFAGGGDATGIEVYRTDGSRDGTALVRDVFPGEDGSRPQNFFAQGDRLYFSAGDSYEPGANRVLHQMWVSQGTPETTFKLSPETIDQNTPFVGYRDEVYYMAQADEAGWELFKTDGTSVGTAMVEDIHVGSGSAFPIPKIVFDDQLLFLADNGINGFEIWSWNGSVAELAEVHLGGGGFTQEPELFQFVSYGNDLLFSGSTPFEGDELFVIRGSAVEPLAGDVDGNNVVEFADFLVLSANFGRGEATRSQGDLDGSGKVDFADFLILSANFGKRG